MSNPGDDIPSQEEESTTSDQSEELKEATRKLIVTSKAVQDDYEKMNKILLKQTGLTKKDIDGMSPKEAFEKLSFLAEYTEPKESAPKRNQKIVPVPPTGIGTENIEGVTAATNPVTGRKTYKIDLTKIYQK